MRIVWAPECVACFVSQAVRAARAVGLPEEKTWELVKFAASKAASLPDGVPPPLNSEHLYGKLEELSGSSDPYREQKRRDTELALRMLPLVRKWVAGDLDRALLAAAVGNTLDMGAGAHPGDAGFSAILDDAESMRGRRWEVSNFKERLESAESLLLIADNAGEVVLDALLLEVLHSLKPELRVAVAVRPAPAINDATVEDALAAGLGKHAELVTTGCKLPGVLLDRCSGDFLRLFERADLVLSKGQGNLETLAPPPRPVFFLLKVKCPVVSRAVGVEQGRFILFELGMGG